MFRRKPGVSDEMAGWIETCFDRFDARFPAPPGPILPTRGFFRAGSGLDHATAEAVLADVTRLLGHDLPIDLVPPARAPGAFRHSYRSLGEVAGTYRETDAGRVITYDPEALARPRGVHRHDGAPGHARAARGDGTARARRRGGP